MGKKRMLRFWISVMCFLLVTAVEAMAANTQVIEGSLILQKMDYRTDSALAQSDKLNGNLAGFQLNYQYNKEKSPLGFEGTFDYTKGDTDYKGDLITGSYAQSKLSNTVLALEGKATYKLPYTLLNDKLKFAAYGGLGYKNWKWEPKVSNAYSQDYTWFYLPMGIRANYAINNKLEASVDFSARPAFSGSVKANFSELGTGLNDVEMDFGHKLGFKVEVPVKYTIDQRCYLTVKPWYEFSGFKESNDTATLNNGAQVYVVTSDEDRYGINIGCGMKF